MSDRGGETAARAALLAQPDVESPRDYYPNFDWLRLLFAVQVVAIHAGIAPHILISPVAAFLAVSGFVVLGSIERLRATSFFLNRALRVLPLLIAMFLFVFVRYGYEEFNRTILFWLWPFRADEPINDVVWTLMYEEVFYALLAGLYAIRFYKSAAPSLIMFICLCVMVATYTFLSLPSTIFFLGASFFLGSAAYILRRWIARINKWVAIAIFVVASVVLWQLPYVSIVSPDDTLEIYASIAAMLVFGIAGPRLPRLKIDLSYSLYLIHTLVRQELFGVVPFGFPMFAAMLAASVPICVASWFLIERPALRFRRRGNDRVRSRSGPVMKALDSGGGAMDGRQRRILTLVLGVVFGALAGVVLGYFAYSTSSGAGGAGDLPLYLSSIWAARDGPLWTAIGAGLGALWAILRWPRMPT